MKNFVQKGDCVTLIAPYAVASGAGMLVGALFAVATAAAAQGASVESCTVGVFDLTALSTDVIAQGAAVYWDDANKRITGTAAGNTKVGCATVAKANGDTTCRVRLNGTV